MFPSIIAGILIIGLLVFCVKLVYLLIKEGIAWHSLVSKLYSYFNFILEHSCLIARFPQLKPFGFAILLLGVALILIRTIAVFGQGFDLFFELPLIRSLVGSIYLLAKDIFELLLIVLCLRIIYRSLRPRKTSLICFFASVAILAFSDIVMQAGLIAAENPAQAVWMPISWFISQGFELTSWSINTFYTFYVLFYLLYLLDFMVILNFLPYLKVE